MQTRNEGVTLSLGDGARVEARLAHMKSVGREAVVELHHWALISQATPKFWVGRLQGELPSFGNLDPVLRTPRSVRADRNGFRLEGAVVWHLISTKEPGIHWVLVDQGDAELTHELLHRDMACMEFAFGAPLHLERLIGIDEDRRSIAAVSVAHYSRSLQRGRAPVPDDVMDACVWIPEFFRLLAHKMKAEGPEPLMKAIGAYMDGECDHLDGGYLKAQVGLEAFAAALIRSQEPNMARKLLVKDEQEWRKWIASLRPTVEAHMCDPARTDMVYGKFMSAMYEPTSDRVRLAMERAGVTLPREAVTEIRNRNIPAHQFWMRSDPEDFDFDRDVRRLELVQTLVAALVSSHVGYAGPLKGYTPDEHGRRPSPEWWPVRWSRNDVWTQYRCCRWLSPRRPNGVPESFC
jgi:hypothetical protein